MRPGSTEDSGMGGKYSSEKKNGCFHDLSFGFTPFIVTASPQFQLSPKKFHGF
jgi:hypothetical protein